MRIKLGSHIFHFFFKHLKVRKAYGIRSGTDRESKHFLLMDFDNWNNLKTVALNLAARFQNERMSICKTPNGFHVIIWKQLSFRETVKELVKTPCIDLNHVAIGIKRNYWFLETRFVKIPHDLISEINFMVIDRT